MTTLADTRDALTGALRAVAALSVTPHEPATLAPLAAWPVFESRDYETPSVWSETWSVYVALNATDLGSAIEAMEALMSAVADALNAVTLAAVLRVEARQLIVSDRTGGVPAIMFTVQIG
jgi:hypothetical protein